MSERRAQIQLVHVWICRFGKKVPPNELINEQPTGGYIKFDPSTKAFDAHCPQGHSSHGTQIAQGIPGHIRFIIGAVGSAVMRGHSWLEPES